MGTSLETRNPGRRGASPELNVTPLVDVVLVLLIIFMVVTPMAVKQFWVHVPEKSETKVEPARRDEPPPVLTLRKDGSLRINKDVVHADKLGERLPRIFAASGDPVLVFDAENGVSFGEAMRIMDLARASGAVTIAVSSRELK